MKFKLRTEADYQRTVKRQRTTIKRLLKEIETLKRRIVQVDSARFEDSHFKATGAYYD